MTLALVLALAGCDTPERRVWHGDVLASASGFEGGADDDDGDVPGPLRPDLEVDWACLSRPGVARGIALGGGVEGGPDGRGAPPDGARPGSPWSPVNSWLPGYPWPDPAAEEPADLPDDIVQPVLWSPFGSPPDTVDDDGARLRPISGLAFAGPERPWPWVPLRWGGQDWPPARAAPAPPDGDARPKGGGPEEEGGPTAVTEPEDERQAAAPTSIAEPATLALLGGALVALSLIRRERARRLHARNT